MYYSYHCLQELIIRLDGMARHPISDSTHLSSDTAERNTASVKRMKLRPLIIAIFAFAALVAIVAPSITKETQAQSTDSQDQAAPDPTPTPSPLNIVLGDPVYVQDEPREIECYVNCEETWGGLKDFGEVLTDQFIQIEFHNPPEVGRFNYGIFIRSDVLFRLYSHGAWWIGSYTQTGSHYEAIQTETGTLGASFNGTPGGSNYVQVTAVDNEACYFVNEEFVTCYTMPEWATAGRVQLSGTYGGIRYSGLEVRPILSVTGLIPIPTATPTPAPIPTPTPTSVSSPTRTPAPVQTAGATPASRADEPSPTATRSPETSIPLPVPATEATRESQADEPSPTATSPLPTPVSEEHRGFFINSTTAADASRLEILLDPLVLTLIGLAITLLATGIQLFKGT